MEPDGHAETLQLPALMREHHSNPPLQQPNPRAFTPTLLWQGNVEATVKSHPPPIKMEVLRVGKVLQLGGLPCLGVHLILAVVPCCMLSSRIQSQCPAHYVPSFSSVPVQLLAAFLKIPPPGVRGFVLFWPCFKGEVCGCCGLLENINS